MFVITVESHIMKHDKETRIEARRVGASAGKVESADRGAALLPACRLFPVFFTSGTVQCSFSLVCMARQSSCRFCVFSTPTKWQPLHHIASSLSGLLSAGAVLQTQCAWYWRKDESSNRKNVHLLLECRRESQDFALKW